MALPGGISTATVTAGVPVTFSGSALRSTVTIKPSAFLVHAATGTPLVDMMEEMPTDEGVAAQFTLPHTDQDGFTDENGNAYKNWYYTATIQYSSDRQTLPPKSKVFQLTTGQTLVDMDLLPGGAPAMPYTAPAATVSSVNGQTGAVVVPSATDAAVADKIINGTQTATALRERFVGFRTVDLEKFLLPGESLPNDGLTDAQPLLQRALDQAALLVPTLGPLSIRLPSGKFTINSSVRWYTGYHVGFVGAGRANTRIFPVGNAVFGLMDPGFISTNLLEDQVFADFTIDCTNQVSAPNNVGAKGIALRYMKNGRFVRVRVINSWATSFGCDFLQDVTFESCTAIRSGRGVTGGHDSFGAGFGIGVGNFAIESVLFSNCYAEDSWSAGFFVERILEIPGTPSDSRGFYMTGCTSLGGYNGLRDAGGDGIVTTGCHFLNASNAGIHIDGYTASGRHGGRNGNVNASVIRGNATGVLIGNAATGGYTFANSEVSGNTGAGFRSTAGGQIGAGWRWLDNRIEGNGAGGIMLGSTLLGRPEFRGNIIRNNGTGDGIRIDGDTYDLRVTDNTIQGHFGAGLYLAGATQFCTDPVVRGNNLTENSKGSIVNEKVTNDSILIAGNREQAAFTTITNEFTTPSYEVSVSLVAALSRLDAPAQMTDGGAFGTSYARLVVNQAGTASARIGRVSATLAGNRTVSFYVRTTKGAIIRPFVVGYWNANASQRTWNKGGIRATGGWQRVNLTVTLPANGSRIDIDVAIDGAVVGQTLDVDATMQTVGTALWPYIDGNQPNCAWTGTAGSSTSVLTIPA